MAKGRVDATVIQFRELNSPKEVTDKLELKREQVSKFVDAKRSAGWTERRIERAVKTKFKVKLAWQSK